jgi:F-type H+-transporting ATPase subunit alpha
MSTALESLQSVFDRAFAEIAEVRGTFTPRLTPREVGTITSIATGIAKVSGLPGVGFEELVKFPGDVFGIAFNVDEDEIGVVLLGDYWHLHAGDEVERSGRVMDVAVGDGLIGRVIDPLGLVHVVRRDHQRDALGGQLEQQIPQITAGHGVDAGGRLVEKD